MKSFQRRSGPYVTAVIWSNGAQSSLECGVRGLAFHNSAVSTYIAQVGADEQMILVCLLGIKSCWWIYQMKACREGRVFARIAVCGRGCASRARQEYSWRRTPDFVCTFCRHGNGYYSQEFSTSWTGAFSGSWVLILLCALSLRF